MKFSLKTKPLSRGVDAGKYPIVLRLKRGNKIIELSTGQAIDRKLWNKKTSSPTKHIYMAEFLDRLHGQFRLELTF